MNTKNFSFSFIFLFIIVFSQQNEEFKQVREYYNHHRSMLSKEFKKKYDLEQQTDVKQSILKDFGLFMNKMDSIENFAMVSALISVRNREDLDRILHLNKTKQDTISESSQDKQTVEAKYPGGFNNLRQQISKLLYTSDFFEKSATLKTEIYFIVESDGSISSVNAIGDNFIFNRQAEIAVYLLPEKFIPAYINNIPVRNRLKLPLTINNK